MKTRTRTPFHLTALFALVFAAAPSPSAARAAEGAPVEYRHHTIKEGDTVTRIARRYRVSAKELASLNELGKNEVLSVGRTLLIPDARSKAPKGAAKEKSEKKRVTFVRVRTGQVAKVSLTKKSGAADPKGRQALSVLAAYQRTVRLKGGKTVRRSKVVPLHPRLVQLLSRVAGRFPDHTFLVTSGYRPKKRGKKPSMHSKGRALDFHIEGVDNRELYAFIKTLPKTGTGYYPNSSFVHLDARDKSYTWVDTSGPGEPAHYERPAAAEDPEALADAESASEDSNAPDGGAVDGEAPSTP